MKKLLNLILTFLVASSSIALAKIWRVDSNTSNAADFRTLSAANASSEVQDGDTLYVAGASTGYGNVTFSKRLVIIGPGYFLGDNPNTQAYPVAASAGTVTFSAGSGESVMTGMSTSDIYISASNVTIKRNYVLGRVNLGSAASINNAIIVQNYITGRITHWTSIYNGQSIIVANNIVMGEGASVAMNSHSGYSWIVQNNVLAGSVTLHNATFENNILRSGTFTPSQTTVQNNLCNGTQLEGLGIGNLLNVTMDNVFLSQTSGSTDGRFQLKETSPAKGAGTNGADCGAFGGPSPYVLSGIPSIPNIYYFTAPAVVPRTEGLQVRIKARSNN
jgi:hypothetical protein